MPNTPPHAARSLRLSQPGYDRLAAMFPPGFKGCRLDEEIARLSLAGNPSERGVRDTVSKNTVGRILARKLPVAYPGLVALFKALGLAICDTDHEACPRPAPAAKNTPYLVPREPCRRFMGREKELKEIRALLAQHRVVAVRGLGGAGKTQTALAYCKWRRGAYKAVFWVRADSDVNVQQGYAAIVRHLHLSGSALAESERALAAQRWLETHSGWLLVLDNLDTTPQMSPDRQEQEPRDEAGQAGSDAPITPNARFYFPPNPKGHVLITTRRERLNLAPLPTPYALPPLSPPDALTFLLNSVVQLGEWQAITLAERKAAEQLAEYLGCLPLAMEQAAAYIARASTFAGYLALFQKRGVAQLNQRTPDRDTSQALIATTWEINFSTIEEEARKSHAAQACAPDLLRFGAFLAPDDIPLELIERGASAFCPHLHELFANASDEAQREEVYSETLEPLTRYALATRQPQARTFSLHRLVQGVTRERLTPTERQEWQTRVVKAVSQAFPLPEFENWKECERLLPHACAIAEIILRDEVMTPEAGLLLHRLACYLYERGNYEQGQTHARFGLEIQRRVHTEDHPDFAAGLNNLALLQNALLRLCSRQTLDDEAMSNCRRALAIRRAALSPDHLDIAESLNDLAELYNERRCPDEAEPLFREALEIAQQNRPQAERRFATIVHNLALLWYRQGRYQEAENGYKQARAIFTHCRPPDPPQLAGCLHNLAELYRNRQRWTEAEPLFKAALRLQQRLHPDGHPETAITHHNLAQLYKATGRHTEAERHFKQMVEEDRKALGENHPEVASDLRVLAEFYQQQGRNREATRRLRQAEAIENALDSSILLAPEDY